MTLAATSRLMADAQAARRGIMAFNVVTLEQAEAVLSAAEATGSDVIIQVSENAVQFHEGRSAPLIAASLSLIASVGVRASVHLDHATSLELCKRAADEGASSVMFDASLRGYLDNIRETRDAATWARQSGVFLEAELGEIGGKQGAHAPNVRTDPGEAQRFVLETGVDALAVAVGSTHAQNSRTSRLEQGLIARLADAVPVPLVLHGSSGVPDDEIRHAVRNGIVKVNVGTALNSAFTGRLRDHLVRHPDEFDLRPAIRKARDAAASVAAHLLDVVSDVR